VRIGCAKVHAPYINAWWLSYRGCAIEMRTGGEQSSDALPRKGAIIASDKWRTQQLSRLKPQASATEFLLQNDSIRIS
jgi:hypothetical protein